MLNEYLKGYFAEWVAVFYVAFAWCVSDVYFKNGQRVRVTLEGNVLYERKLYLVRDYD